MKFLKYLLLFLLLIVLVYLGLCLVGPKTMDMTRTTTMQAPPAMGYNLTSDFEKMNSWSPWATIDPNTKYQYSPKTSGVGAFMTWESEDKNVGKGRQEIVSMVKNEQVVSELEFDGFDGKSTATFDFEPNGDKTNVSWSFKNGSPFPFLFRGLLLVTNARGALKEQYDTGLANIKRICEERAEKKEYNGFKIIEVDIPARNYIMTRQRVGMSQIEQFYSRNIGNVIATVATQGITPTNSPSALFFSWNEKDETTDMAAAIGVPEEINIENYSYFHVPTQQAVQVDYFGDNDGSIKAHEAIGEYLSDYGLLNDWPVIEEYVTDPTKETDPSKWLTKITYYIAQ